MERLELEVRRRFITKRGLFHSIWSRSFSQLCQSFKLGCKGFFYGWHHYFWSWCPRLPQGKPVLATKESHGSVYCIKTSLFSSPKLPIYYYIARFSPSASLQFPLLLASVHFLRMSLSFLPNIRPLLCNLSLLIWKNSPYSRGRPGSVVHLCVSFLIYLKPSPFNHHWLPIIWLYLKYLLLIIMLLAFGFIAEQLFCNFILSIPSHT